MDKNGLRKDQLGGKEEAGKKELAGEEGMVPCIFNGLPDFVSYMERYVPTEF